MVQGWIDKDGIREVIQAHADEIRSCYEQELAQDPQLHGRVVLKWIVQADGSASDGLAEKLHTTLPSEKVLECMISRVATWTFPRPARGGIAVITYPWILRTATADGDEPAAK